MDINVLAKIAGVLGFIISVFTFTLTRLERRKKCVVEIVIGGLTEYADELCEEEDLSDEVIKIRITNIGGQPIIINSDSFYFTALSNSTRALTKNKLIGLGVIKYLHH